MPRKIQAMLLSGAYLAIYYHWGWVMWTGNGLRAAPTCPACDGSASRSARNHSLIYNLLVYIKGENAYKKDRRRQRPLEREVRKIFFCRLHLSLLLSPSWIVEIWRHLVPFCWSGANPACNIYLIHWTQCNQLPNDQAGSEFIHSFKGFVSCQHSPISPQGRMFAYFCKIELA